MAQREEEMDRVADDVGDDEDQLEGGERRQLPGGHGVDRVEREREKAIPDEGIGEVAAEAAGNAPEDRDDLQRMVVAADGFHG